jgi:chlorobactene glucosyltransferase
VPRAAATPPLEDGPLVSVIVPARDEARDVGGAVASLRAQRYRPLEVIVVDDESRDATRARAEAAGGGDPRVRVLAGLPLPPGWVGKSWACWQGVLASRGEWLLFTDADVVHAPDALGRALALAERLGRGGLTLAPRLVCVGVAERAVLPAVVAAIGTFVAPGPLARSARSPMAMAAGGYILVRRALYERVGGHRAVGARMVDDVALAERVKRAGGLLAPARGAGLVSLRMYRGAREVWQGWRKNASFGAAGSPAKGLVGGLVVGGLGLAPPLATAVGLRRREPRLIRRGLAGLVAQAALQRLIGDIAPTPRRYALTVPVGAAVLGAAAVRGALERMAGRGPEWRGRRYPGATG